MCGFTLTRGSGLVFTLKLIRAPTLTRDPSLHPALMSEALKRRENLKSLHKLVECGVSQPELLPLPFS